ncbi:unnamed protein product [Bursaphelenchus xylophilus]|uniref:(pine wood nematode) hypothetical protein n=1 Tax=Bursaphelenchus xylophilus TaxID=6326 RepID=A0A1I7S4E3_BURXY|nr:unnamed protein product [Bursaphelenchus xylophilus]CAG9117003.1 unnamed protein product [Bursaphelenchus xylophilus]
MDCALRRSLGASPESELLERRSLALRMSSRADHILCWLLILPSVLAHRNYYSPKVNSSLKYGYHYPNYKYGSYGPKYGYYQPAAPRIVARPTIPLVPRTYYYPTAPQQTYQTYQPQYQQPYTKYDYSAYNNYYNNYYNYPSYNYGNYYGYGNNVPYGYSRAPGEYSVTLDSNSKFYVYSEHTGNGL